MGVTTYTVYHHDGLFPAEPGLTLAEAADRMLTYDGHEYEIRSSDDSGFELWHTPFSRNGPCGGRPMVKTAIYSVKDDRSEAEEEIFLRAINSGYWSPISVMEDSRYAAMIAELEEEQDQ